MRARSKYFMLVECWMRIKCVSFWRRGIEKKHMLNKRFTKKQIMYVLLLP